MPSPASRFGSQFSAIFCKHVARAFLVWRFSIFEKSNAEYVFHT